MVKKLTIKNFKCYEDAEINFAGLTVFSGQNAVGKSTVLQALNLLRQASMDGFALQSKIVRLNGSLVRLCEADDVINYKAPRNMETRVMLKAEGDQKDESCELVFGRMDDNSNAMAGTMSVYTTDFHGEKFMGDKYVYLSADRISPNTSFGYPKSEEAYAINPIGNRGEYAVWLLGQNYSRIVENEAVLYSKSEKEGMNTLGRQVEIWMGKLGCELQLHIDIYDNLKLASLKFGLLEGDSYSRWLNPLNVGFGLTHSLPIFVALLSAKNGSIVMIENPESHLHPKAQVLMGKFIARVASSGVQVIVETHSDHVLNGIRLAVKECSLRAEDVALNFMTKCNDSVQVVSPKMFPSGAIDVWPRGFFDEYENVSLELL